MWLALTTVTGSNVVININRIGGIWEQKDGTCRLLIDGDETYVRDAYQKVVAAIQTVQPLIG